MAKVKMRDITSGSENVKTVFRAAMTVRTKLVHRLTFTDDELIEILNISEDIEYHRDKRNFYQQLIKSQPGPFNISVFRAFIDKLYEKDSLVHLITHSSGLNMDDKIDFINTSMVTDVFYFIYNFYNKGEGKKNGIDITKGMLGITYATNMVRYGDKQGRGNIPEGLTDMLYNTLDNLSDDEIYKWYLDSVATTYEKRAMDYIMLYDKMPNKVIMHYYNKTNPINQERLVTHENCDYNLKIEMYENTHDPKFLPVELAELFLI